MSTVTVTTSADAAVNDGTAASLTVVNTGAFSAFIRRGSGPDLLRKLRPGERGTFQPEGQIITARGDDGTTTLDVNAVAAATTDLAHLAGGAVQRTGETTALDWSGASSVRVPTATPGDNSTKAASTAFAKAAIDALIASAPGALDTLAEIDAALGNDANLAATITTALGLKAPLASPTFSGSPTAPTPTAGDSSTKIATTAFASALASGGIKQASAGVRASIARGSRSTCILAIGDSTGDERLEWFGVLGDRLAALYPAYSVIMRTWAWDGSSDEYGPEVAISAGTGNGGGARYVEVPSGSLLYSANTGTFTSDISYRAKVLPNTAWAPGGAAASRTIVSRYNASGGNRHSWFYLDESGNLKFTWSAAGTADTATVTSTSAVPFSAGTAGWVRVDFDSDNTASGSTTTFYTATDGVTWTQLGTPVVTAGASSLSSSTYQFQLGNRNATPTDPLNGRIYWIEARSTLTTSWAPIIPYVPEQWRQGTNPDAIIYGGAPIILLMNGHKGGTAISFYNDSVRRLKMHGQFGQQLVILSEGHNEGTINGPDWRVAYDTWVADARNRSKYIPFILAAQNPAGSVGDSIATIANGSRADRGRDIVAYAASMPGCYPLDIYPIFIAAANGNLSTLIPDNIHPGQGAGSGSELWGNYVYSQLFA